MSRIGNVTFSPQPRLSVSVPTLARRSTAPAPRPQPYRPMYRVESRPKEGGEGEEEVRLVPLHTAAAAKPAAPAAGVVAPAAAAMPSPADPAPLAPIKVYNKWKCPTCGKLYVAKHNLDRHMEKESGIRYECTIPGCTSKAFSRFDSLPRHNQAKHPGQAVQSRTIYVQTEQEDDDEDNDELNDEGGLRSR